MGRTAGAPAEHHRERGLPRKPNHSFERRRRVLAKAEKKAAHPAARAALNRGSSPRFSALENRRVFLHESPMEERDSERAGKKAFYERLGPVFRQYVDELVRQVATLLWPERRAALVAFYRGIAGAPPDELRASIEALGLPLDDAETYPEQVFRAVLTAWIERIGVEEVTNPDQAVLYALSYEDEHVARAEAWFAERPEHLAAVSAGAVEE